MPLGPEPNDRPNTGGGTDDEFMDVLRSCVTALDDSTLPYAVIGGVASAAYGRPRWTKDIDVMCQPADADAVLDVLADAGFDVERTNPAWIFKAFRQDVLVDVIFKAKADLYFDDDMQARVRTLSFQGIAMPVAAPEDMIVMKAVASDESSPWHWFDAIGILAVNDLDWDYLLERGRKSPNRLSALLHFAISLDVPAPTKFVRQLDESIAEGWSAS
jgi:predicted nucleotidyltransferase